MLAKVLRVLGLTLGYVVFAVAVEAMWIVLQVDIAEDLNIFGEAPCWPWPIGSTVLYAVLTTWCDSVRRPVDRHVIFFGALAVLFVSGLVVLFRTQTDGLAIALVAGLNAVWLVTIAAYRGLTLVVGALWRRRIARKRRPEAAA